MKRLAWLVLLLPATVALAAPPQTVYRCGPDGRIYSQTPCADGKALSADDPRSSSQQKAARDVADRDAEQARKLADERRQRDAAAKEQQAAGFKSAPSEPAASAAPRKPKAKASAPGSDAAMSPAMRVPAQGTSGK